MLRPVQEILAESHGPADEFYAHLEKADMNVHDFNNLPEAVRLIDLRFYGVLSPTQFWAMRALVISMRKVPPEPEDNFVVKRIATGKVVGRIAGIHEIKQADHVWTADVDVGDGEDKTRQIMWGGVNILRPGHHVAVALPGARLASGKKLRASTYTFGEGEQTVRVRSEGMLMSPAEAGWDERIYTQNQVVVLPDQAGLIPGQSLDGLHPLPDGTLPL